MPHTRRVYGKKAPRGADLAAQCFAFCSSPRTEREGTKGNIQSSVRMDDVFYAEGNATSECSKDPDNLSKAFKSLSVRGSRRRGGEAVPALKDPIQRQTSPERRALGPRDTNVVPGSPRLPKTSSFTELGKKISVEQSPAAIAAELRTALWSQPQCDGASGVNASPSGNISSVHVSPAQNTRSCVRRQLYSLECLSPNGLPTPPESPSASRRPRRTLLRQTSPASASSTTPVEIYADYVAPLLKLCKDPEGRIAPRPFQPWADSVDEHLHITKIAEASYGEVYRLSPRDRQLRLSKAADSVVKVIALKPPADVETRRTKAQEKRINNMSAAEDVAGEGHLLQRMSDVPGFANFRECRVFQGQTPTQFVKAWRDFNRNVKKSQFPDPGRRGSYEDAQLWAVLEMEDAGRDLENLCENRLLDDDDGDGDDSNEETDSFNMANLRSIWGIWDIFWGVALAVAKGEEWARFEVSCPSRKSWSDAETTF